MHFAAHGQGRTPPDRALPADRGRHPRHQPEGMECLERQAAGRPVPHHAARAGRRNAVGRSRTARTARKRRSRPCGCTVCRATRTKRSGSSSMSPTSCATTPPISPGRPASLYDKVDSARPVVKCRLSPIGEGLQIAVYTKDQPDLFARICSYFDRKNFSILDAKIHTTKHGYALDTFLVTEPAFREQLSRHHQPDRARTDASC